ncbi:baseplate J/gp47 family protein [Paraburkholderia sp. RL17-337-BIB-A]|uniref:baseplate J/gp47 family protein n=1 Tax=Paraburkholderia sp. RL17-337-BIB-A TaxID=3031636 RepID=UPI0038B8CDDD
MTDDCSQNIDALKLVREGTSQDDRTNAALAPDSALADARTVADGIVFAQGYAALLQRYDANNVVLPGHWSDYFGTDAAVPLAVAATEDVDQYRQAVRGWFDYLNDLSNATDAEALKDRLGYLYAAIGTLAQALDTLAQSLPDAVALKGVLRNLIGTQLAPAFRRLVAYYKGGESLGVVNAVAPSPDLWILRRKARAFADVLTDGLSAHWRGAGSWDDYLNGTDADATVYGAGGAPDPFTRINHCSTHNLFRAVFDQFLKVFGRTVSVAQSSLVDTIENSSAHAPHYALYLAFLQLLEHARNAGNTLTQRHLDFYYRTILGLKEKPAQPGYVHLLAVLAKQTQSHDFPSGELFKAGKDSAGKNAFFANTADFVANKAVVAALKTVYRHGSEPVPGQQDQGRIYAAPAANSTDGLGAPLPDSDPSWQPFFNKVYVNGALAQIDMPPAQIGFAIASHYLLMAEGMRSIVVSLTTGGTPALSEGQSFAAGFDCRLTTAKGWLDKRATSFVARGGVLELRIDLTGADDAIAPYAPATHGYDFDTTLPLLVATLVQDFAATYAYGALQDVTITAIDIDVSVTGMKSLVVANDFGTIDLSKPFQPFGSSAVAGSSLVIGSKEIFQKHLVSAELDLTWQVAPTVYPQTSSVTESLQRTRTQMVQMAIQQGKVVAQTKSMPHAGIEFLRAGVWTPSQIAAVSLAPASGMTTSFALDASLDLPVLDAPDFDPDQAYGTQSRHGFVRLSLDDDIGQSEYQLALIAYLRKDSEINPGPKPPQGPIAAALTMNYAAHTTLALNSATTLAFKTRTGRFFHLAPFGTAEQHPYLGDGAPVPLLPPFGFVRGGAPVASEAELYIGITGLAPPQNLSLLFQVVDGTANPLSQKPSPHIDWSYLASDRWVEFPENAITDATSELLGSGITTFAVPGDATRTNRLLPAGMFWIRAAVSQASDAVCRLQLVAAQALKAVFSDQGNAPDFSATPLPPGTVTQLATPDADVKSVAQPFASFGGRGAERPADFYRRVSERLRHKDRAIDLWDYEHLILEAFPAIYKAKCLNHTCYEPADSEGATPCSGGIYRELAPGHVTIVTLPDLKSQQQTDPLKPYTSLGLLSDIEAFVRTRAGCFVQLHVRNPQFEEVRVAFKLKLYDGYDRAWYTTQLQQAITRFLSPWAFGGSGAPSFGGMIRKAALIDFVENQPYVDYVTDFQLFHDIPCQPPGTEDLDEVAGSHAVSILVSAPAGAHAITAIEAEPDRTLAESCGCGA